MKRKISLLLLIMMLFVSGCQTASLQPEVNTTPQATSEAIPTPSAGKAIATGRLMSLDGKVPYNNVVVRLARVYRDGDQAAFALDMGSSPGDYTDSNGVFVITDVPAAEYVVIIGDPEVEPVVISDDKNDATVYEAKAGETLEIGDLKVDYVP